MNQTHSDNFNDNKKINTIIFPINKTLDYYFSIRVVPMVQTIIPSNSVLLTKIKNKNHKEILSQLIKYLQNHEVNIFLIPKILPDFVSLSILIPKRFSMRIHLKIIHNFKQIQINNNIIEILYNNWQNSKINNYLIFIREDFINQFDEKRQYFRYIDCREYYSCKSLLTLIKKGLPFEFYNEHNKLNDLTGKEWINFTKSWFIAQPPPRNNDEILHPAKFPENLIEDFIRFFSKKGQVILDPFMGTGSTLIAAVNTMRSGVGIELNEKYWEISKNRIERHKNKMIKNIQNNKYINSKILDTNKIEKSSLNLDEFYKNSANSILSFEKINLNDDFNEMLELFHVPILGDTNDIEKIWQLNNFPKVNFCITSPPYWNQLKRNNFRQKNRKSKGLDTQYSSLKQDIGNIDNYSTFLQKQFEIFSKIDKILIPNSYICIITNNVYTDGRLFPLAYDTAISLSKLWTLKDEKIWCQNDKALMPLGVNSAWIGNRHHQYCLIFRKE